MTQPLACFTIARNESFFLPMWLRYYEQLNCPLYVLDHESNDGSTANINAHRVPITREHTDDVAWMLHTVEHFFEYLLNEYDYARVVFAEVDEFLIPEPTEFASLKQYLDSKEPLLPLTATGYDVCGPGAQPPFDPIRCVLEQRPWKRNSRYDKTLISGRPLTWEVGFHKTTCLAGEFPDPDLLLIHLHYMDREVAWNRLVTRMAGRQPYPNDWGRENKIRDRQKFDEVFEQMCEGSYPVPNGLKKLI